MQEAIQTFVACRADFPVPASLPDHFSVRDRILAEVQEAVLVALLASKGDPAVTEALEVYFYLPLLKKISQLEPQDSRTASVFRMMNGRIAAEAVKRCLDGNRIQLPRV